MNATTRGGAPIAAIAAAIGLIAVLLLLASGIGARMELWTFRTGFSLLRLAAWGGIAAVVLGVGGLIAGRGQSRAAVLGVIAVLLGITAAAVPIAWRRASRSVPPIHDITTDLSDPPAFVAVVPLRADAPNPPEYAGEETARQQRESYPTLGPLMLDEPPAAAFERALEAARGMGWEIVAAEPADGRIEATAETKWFGFKDDVVIRVRAEGAGSRVDVRSKSRVGGGDVGTNARRIRTYLKALED